MKARRTTIFISVSLIVICIVFGIITRLSYGTVSLIESENTLDIKGPIYRDPLLTYGDGLYGLKEYGIINDTADNLYEILKRKSTLIVIAKKSGLSEIQQQCILTKLEIKKVYKGNEELVGKSIWVYEPVVFIGYGKPNAYWDIEKGYTNIDRNKEYLLMLENIEFSKSKFLNEEQKNSYKITSMSAFGKYTTNSVFQESLPGDTEYTYKDIQNFEIICGTNDDLKIYNYIKKKILEDYINR